MRRRRGATETEGGVHSSGILLGWSISAAPLMSTQEPESEVQQNSSSLAPSVLPIGTKPHTEKEMERKTHKWIFLYQKKTGNRVYFV